MKNLLFVSVCFLLLSCSCAPSFTEGCRKGTPRLLSKEELPAMVPLSNRIRTYNMTIDFMRKHFSGLLVAKQTQAGTCRILFSTHFGLSLLDLEIGHDFMQVHHCIEPLNKKKMLALLRRDFAILFGLSLEEENLAVPYLCPKSPHREIYYIKTSAFKGYYRKDKSTGRLQEIRIGSGLRKTTFCSKPEPGANTPSIRIRHTGLRLSIGLDPLP